MVQVPVRAAVLSLVLASVIGAALLAIVAALTPADHPETFQNVAVLVLTPFLALGLAAAWVGPRLGLRSIFGPLERGDFALALRRLGRARWLGFPVDGFRASVLLEAGRVGEAEALFQALVAGDGPYWARHATSLAVCLAHRGELAEAERWLGRAINRDPDHAAARLRLAEVDLARGLADDTTLEAVELAVALYRVERRAWFTDEYPIAEALASRGWALALREATRAKVVAELGLALGLARSQRYLPGRAAVHLRAGRALLALGEVPSAREQFAEGAALCGLASRQCGVALASLDRGPAPVD